MEENRESMKNRIKEAAKYQKMAIHALLPESVDSHLQVIEQEMKGMAKDLLFEVVESVMAYQMENDNGTGTHTEKENQEEKAQNKKIHKVTID